MRKNILLLDGSKVFGSSEGRLNKTLHALAKEVLQGLGYTIEETNIDQGYTPAHEAEKVMKADVLIYQMPGWWMGEPWIVKKYIDEVYILLYGKLYDGDGRTRADSSKKYGTGGIDLGKRYLLSSTWNAPLEAFTEKDQFFAGQGIDGVFFHLHKAHQFVGMKALESFTCYDVVKAPAVEEYKARYTAHLTKIFG